VLLWTVRIGLIAAFGSTSTQAASLTLMNRRARPDTYKSPRDYVAADFAPARCGGPASSSACSSCST
jgi:succinate dehydrogenase / fumarate reductase cytochrome b subunit